MKTNEDFSKSVLCQKLRVQFMSYRLKPSREFGRDNACSYFYILWNIPGSTTMNTSHFFFIADNIYATLLSFSFKNNLLQNETNEKRKTSQIECSLSLLDFFFNHSLFCTSVDAIGFSSDSDLLSEVSSVIFVSVSFRSPIRLLWSPD